MAQLRISNSLMPGKYELDSTVQDLCFYLEEYLKTKLEQPVTVIDIKIGGFGRVKIRADLGEPGQ